MCTFTQWMDHQKRVYWDFVNGLHEVETSGLRADPVMTFAIGGVAVVFRHPRPIVQRVSALSQSAARLVPMAQYNGHNIHTSICAAICRDYSWCDDQRELARGLYGVVQEEIKTLSRAAHGALRVHYVTPLLNPTTLVYPGDPSSAYFDFISRMTARCQALEPAFRLPWGCHITAGRFLRRQALDSKIQRVVEHVRCAQALNISRFTSITVAAVEAHAEQVKLRPLHYCLLE